MPLITWELWLARSVVADKPLPLSDDNYNCPVMTIRNAH
jgi:hypothetical protein